MHLTFKEQQIITDTDFLITKTEVVKKIHAQFEEARKHIKNVIAKSEFNFSNNIDTENGKIFRGENYRSLPYLVLDYPKLFSKESTFAYRTMFWWGNLFSSTLHLEGNELEKYNAVILTNYKLLIEEDVFISVGTTPWEYHYEKSNYELIDETNYKLIKNCKFLKLSKKFDLSDFDNLPKLSANYFSILLSILS
ncbi:MAG: hypothetical protein KDC67_13095 [Ignavibacteriae bacterium]|nr:hypothetical protein [Ignavibacteriota bacterium]